MKEVMKFTLANADSLISIAAIILSMIVSLNSGARGAMAAVFKIMQDGMEMTPEQRLQKASDLMGQKFPYIPEILRKQVIQFAFDSMNSAVKKNIV